MNNNLTEEEAKAIVSGSYGKALRELSFQFIAPIFWKKPNTNRSEIIINHGTIFFVNTGSRIFAITANHVYKAYLEAKKNDKSIKPQIGNIIFELSERLIDSNNNIDIATFDINENELKQLNRNPFRGSQNT